MSGPRLVEGQLEVGSCRVAIVAARFNDFIVSSLLKGAIGAWQKHGGVVEDLLIARVPGAFELPIIARKLALGGRHDAIVTLGCVIRGDTPHFEYVAGECARGLQQVSCDTGVPVSFGVLTVETVEQALERANVAGENKGAAAMETALEMGHLLARLTG